MAEGAWLFSAVSGASEGKTWRLKVMGWLSAGILWMLLDSYAG